MEQAKIYLGREIDSIIGEAEQMAEPADGCSKAERLSGIKQNRRDEREYLKNRRHLLATIRMSGNNNFIRKLKKCPQSYRCSNGKWRDESLYGAGMLPGTGDIGIPREPHD